MLGHNFPQLPSKLIKRKWLGNEVDAWVEHTAKASDADKAVMREKIRVSTLSRRAAIRSKKDAQAKALVTAAKVGDS